MPTASRSLRILFHTGIDVSARLGHAVHVRRLIDAFVLRGHRVRAIAIGKERPAPGSSEFVARPWLGPPDGLIEVVRPPWPKLGHLALQTRTVRVLRAELRSFRPDVLLTRAEFLSFVPLLLPSRTPPLCVEVNGLMAVQGRAVTPALFRLGAEIERRVLERAVVAAAPSQSLLDDLAARFDLDRARLYLVPNGAFLPALDPDTAVRARRHHGVRDDEFLLGFFGNLSPWQSLPSVLEALASLRARRWRCWIVGEGARLEETKLAARRFGVADRVHFLGSREEEEAAMLAQSEQALIAPYHDSFLESSGGVTLKVLQAMACDRPILVSAPGSADSSSLEAEEPPVPLAVAGESVRPNTAAGWADVLTRWMSRWETAGRPLEHWPWNAGEGPGRRFVTEHRTWDRTAERWEHAMLQALAGRCGTSPR